jgi:Ca2+-binding RTX toxin-like protein
MQGMLSNGNEGNDTISYSSPVINASSIYGGIGDDIVTVTGEVSNAFISGDDGNDRITGGIDVSSSTVRGGNGNDTIIVLDITGSSTVIGNTGNDFIEGILNEKGAVTRGGEGQDTILIFSNRSFVNGNQGNDRIEILASGSIGSDIGTVRGGDGNDSITSRGGTTYAQVVGDTGADTLIDASGDNRFSYSFGDTALTGIAGYDVITGFDSANNGTRDRVQLSSGDMVFNIAGLTGGITINSDAVVTGGVSNLLQFIQEGASLTTAGAAIGVNALTISTTDSFIFISDGDGKRSSGDLLIGFTSPITALTFFEGDIVSLG